MAQTRDFKETVAARVKSNPAFAQALLDEALTLFIGGDSDTAKLILSDLANVGCGLESLESIQNVEQAAKLKALREAIAVGLASGPDIEAAEVSTGWRPGFWRWHRTKSDLCWVGSGRRAVQV